MMELRLESGLGSGRDGGADWLEDGDPLLVLSELSDFAAEPIMHAHSKNADPKMRRKSVFKQ
jgi:hypothetical protein